MFALVVVAALLFWLGVFVTYFASHGSSFADVFLGKHEPLPPDLGAWRDAGSDEAGLLREERCLLPEGQSDPSYLLCQVRFRDPETRAVVRVEPEARVRRRRGAR